MELTSPIFFISLAVLFLLHWGGPVKLRSAWLLAGSYLLYALWDLRYIFVLLGSTVLDFTLGILLDREKRDRNRRLLLFVSLFSNLGILFFFKYANFGMGIYAQIAGSLGLPYRSQEIELFIPLGVSFYTFHSISYIVDIYWGKVRASRSLVEYALYVSFFPKLISGPIERTERFIVQLREPRNFIWEEFFQAIKLILYGLVLKLCIGDRLSYVTEKVFSTYETSDRVDLWLGYYGYSFQIYADFFGYTMVATGAALLFGIKLSPNFIHPYFSATPQEFWRRWHITLSSWFRDYVYIPLGGNRRRMYFNMMLTMALAGLWHGANLKFVVWGIYHGALVCAQRLIVGDAPRLKGWQRLPGIFITFHLVSFGWILFKAKDLNTAISFVGRMFMAPALAPLFDHPMVVWSLVLSGAWALTIGVIKIFDLLKVGALNERVYPAIPLRGALLGGMLLLVMLLGVTNAEPFVYFYF